jgi:hypothetical protein
MLEQSSSPPFPDGRKAAAKNRRLLSNKSLEASAQLTHKNQIRLRHASFELYTLSSSSFVALAGMSGENLFCVCFEEGSGDEEEDKKSVKNTSTRGDEATMSRQDFDLFGALSATSPFLFLPSLRNARTDGW